MSYYALTDKGKIRKQNEDVFKTRELPGLTLLVVCDGMGGMNAGEVASGIAAETFVGSVCDACPEKDCLEDDVRAALRTAVTAAGEAICDDAEEHPEREGMGTTLVAAAVMDSGLTVIANVGDSRAYHIKGVGAIRRVTRDHSVVEDMVVRGDLTPEQARTHPRRNLITRALGTIRGEMPDIFTVSLDTGDSLLLCSDGLSGTVRDEEMADIVKNAREPQQACEKLLKLALKRGAPDNVTIIIYVKDNGRAD